MYEVSSEHEWLKWGSEIQDRMNEARATLMQEKADHEMLLSFKLDDKFYILFIVLFQNELLYMDLNNELNKKHRKLMDNTILRQIKLNKVYEIL